MTWVLVPCLPTVQAEGLWTASCALTEGDGLATNHSHWVDDFSGVEVVTGFHRTGEVVAPNCFVRKVGS